MITITTKRMLCQAVAERYRKQYSEGQLIWPVVTPFNGEARASLDIYHELVALGPEPSEADVDRVIGNSSWTRLTCSNCKRSVDALANFDGWEETVQLCKDCLKDALQIMEQAEG